MSGSDGQRDRVQRRAIETASDVFERFLEELDRPGAASGRIDAVLEGFADGERPGVWEMRRTFARAIDLYADLAQRTFELYADAVEARVRPRAGGAAAVLLTGRPGGETAAAVWLHNPSRAQVTDVALHLTDLIAHDGGRIEASLGSFSPGRLDVEPSASASATLSVRIPEDAGPSVYYGHVLALGVPHAGVPTRLVVE